MTVELTRIRLAILVGVGMMLLIAGVVAGSAVGTLIRPLPEEDITGRPLLLGQSNGAGERSTRLFANTSGGALWSTQRGPGTGVRGESQDGHGGVFITKHRNGYGLLATNDAGSSGTGAALTGQGNRNTGVRAISEDGVGLWTISPTLAIYADGSVRVTGDAQVDGICTCASGMVAINASGGEIEPGTVVTFAGLGEEDDAGERILLVEPAEPGTPPVGVAAGRLVGRPAGGGESASHYESQDDAANPGDLLQVITSGVVEALVDQTARPAEPGSPVAVGGVAGTVSLTESSGDYVVGYVLAPQRDGRIQVLLAGP